MNALIPLIFHVNTTVMIPREHTGTRRKAVRASVGKTQNTRHLVYERATHNDVHTSEGGDIHTTAHTGIVRFILLWQCERELEHCIRIVVQ